MPQPGVEVLNEHPLEFPRDVKIAVLNKNSEIFQRRFDGIDYEFVPGEAQIIDCQAAFNMFAVETRTPPGQLVKLRRDKNYGPGGNNNSYYIESALAVGMNDAESRKFFDNFDFRLVKSMKKMTAMDFDKIPVK